MIPKILYIDNAVEDAVALKQILSLYGEVELEVCESMQELKGLNLEPFDAIICNTQLPDANYEKLKEFLVSFPNVQFVCSSCLDGEPIWLKPISKENIAHLCCFKRVINLEYLDALASDDSQYKMEVLQSAYKLLPIRLRELEDSFGDIKKLKCAAHRLKSYYRVCGIDNNLLNDIEEMSELKFEDKEWLTHIIKFTSKTIKKATKELEMLIGHYKLNQSLAQ